MTFLSSYLFQWCPLATLPLFSASSGILRKRGEEAEEPTEEPEDEEAMIGADVLVLYAIHGLILSVDALLHFTCVS